MHNNELVKGSQRRLKELDAFRGIAAMIVLASHYTWAYDYHFNTLANHHLHFPHGEFGVQIFFMISGFVIFMSLEKVLTLKEFIIARFSRLYPTYWVCMGITIIMITIFPVPTLGKYTGEQILYNLTMLQGFFKKSHVDQVYWSLGVELIFYFLMGVLYLFKQLKWIDRYCIGWLALCAGSWLFSFPLQRYLVNLLLLKSAPLFIAGIMFYKIKTRNSNCLSHIILVISLVEIIVFQRTELDNRGQYAVTATPFLLLALAYISFYLISYFNFNWLQRGILVFLGGISYPLYLLHNVIGYAIIYRVKIISDNQFIYVSMTAIFAIFLAWLVSKYIEKPSVIITRGIINNIFI